MKTFIFRKVEASSLAKVYGMMGVLLGFVVGAIMSLGGMFLSSIMPEGSGNSFGLLSLVLFPIIYGVMCFISGYVGGLLLNLVLKLANGLEISVEEKA